MEESWIIKGEGRMICTSRGMIWRSAKRDKELADMSDRKVEDYTIEVKLTEREKKTLRKVRDATIKRELKKPGLKKQVEAAKLADYDNYENISNVPMMRHLYDLTMDSRSHITLDDLQKCMKSVVNKYTKRKVKSEIVYQVHPGYKDTMVKFEYNGKTKNVKLLSDMAIVLKY